MKRTFKNTILLMAALATVSCSEWDDHYDAVTGYDSNLNLYETLSANPQTTRFASIVTQAGYADLLQSSQTFTVFAPTNDALAGFDESNADSVSRLVTNHIARYSQPSSTAATQSVRMYNGKVYHFDDASSFSGSQLVSKDILANNGIVHTLSSRIPFAYNLYEYIQSEPSLSSLYAFLHKFDKTDIDTDNSIETGIDEAGRPTYDTVWVSANRLLENLQYGIGDINDEDSTYTMILPNNDAWQSAYDRISPYYALYDEDSAAADSLRDVRTGIAIVSDLVYRGSHDTPQLEDSLLSTTGSVVHNTESLFSNAQRVKLSNGYAFVTSSLNYDNTETWNKAIGVEAEEQNGRNYNNTLTSVYTRTVSSESLVDNVSGDSYIEVMPISASTNPSVVFEIPNVLAGEYNIYAVFLPPTVEGATEEADSTCVSFSLSYQNARGRTQTKNNRDKTLLTSGSEVAKLLAFENFEFPVSDYTDRVALIDDKTGDTQTTATTQLTVSTNVTTSEYTSKKLSRTFRLDRIILEPIRK